MINTRPCRVCGIEFSGGRKNKTLCSVDCFKAEKSAYDIARYPNHREQKIAASSQWQIDNKAKKQQYDSDHRIATFDRDRDKRNLATSIYSRAHPEMNRIKQSKRRASRVANGAFAVTARDTTRLLAHANNRCSYCFGSFTEANPLEWDHVIPIRRGGQHSVGNLVPSCRDCNRSKSVRFVTEWRIGRVVAKGPSLR